MNSHTVATILLASFAALTSGCAAETSDETDGAEDEISTTSVRAFSVTRSTSLFVPPGACYPGTMKVNVAFALTTATGTTRAHVDGSYCSTTKNTVTVDRDLANDEVTSMKSALRALKLESHVGPIPLDAPQVDIDVVSNVKPPKNPTKRYTDVRNPAHDRTSVRNGVALAEAVLAIVSPPPVVPCFAMPACQPDETPAAPSVCAAAKGVTCTTRTLCGRSITCSRPVVGGPGPGKEGGICGGVAGFKCDLGLTCHVDANYPDASGVCEK